MNDDMRPGSASVAAAAAKPAAVTNGINPIIRSMIFSDFFVLSAFSQPWHVYALQAILTGIGTSIAAIGGGFLADHYGFKIIFVLTGIIAVFGSCLLIYARRKDIERKEAIATADML